MDKSQKMDNGSAAAVGYEAELWPKADALRGRLLPKLISGELRVKDAKHIIAEVTA